MSKLEHRDPFDHQDGDAECPCVFCEGDRMDTERATVADDEDNRGAFAFGELPPAASKRASPALVPGHENDLKLAEIIATCMASMTAEGLHWLLCEAMLQHQADPRADRWCETCRGRRPA